MTKRVPLGWVPLASPVPPWIAAGNPDNSLSHREYRDLREETEINR